MNSKRIAGYRRYRDTKQILVNSHRWIRSHRDHGKRSELYAFSMILGYS